MKYLHLPAVLLLFAAAPAAAASIANLDSVPHEVVLESAGRVEWQKTLQPGEVARTYSAPGWISLKDGKNRQRFERSLDYAIWPKSGLVIQFHRKRDGLGD